MIDRPPAVLRWPTSPDLAKNLVIVAVNTKNSPIRENARLRVREVLREILGDIELVSIPGQPIHLRGPDNPPGISFSHESGLSLIAIHREGQVGIDLLCPPEHPDWLADIPLLARDYLKPTIAGEIAALPQAERGARFAQAWAAQEARLKCCGLALTEWTAALEVRLAPCRVWPLDLPDGYVGAVACLKSGENQGV